MTEQRLRAYIEQVVRRYCDRFWEDHTDVFTFCMAEKDVSGMASYLYPDDYIKQKISDAYYADLMNGQLTSVFQAIKQSLAVQSMKRYQKAMRDYVALMNTNIGVRISDSSWKEGGNRPPDRVCAHQEQRKVPADSRKSRWRGESGV